MTAFYGSNWTDKFADTMAATILIRSWFMALKTYPEDFIINSIMDYHHTHEYSPSSPSQLLATMQPKYRSLKQEETTQKMLAAPRQQEEIGLHEVAQHKAIMMQLDLLRTQIGLSPFDEDKFKTDAMMLGVKAHYYLNLMYSATGRLIKYTQ